MVTGARSYVTSECKEEFIDSCEFFWSANVERNRTRIKLLAMGISHMLRVGKVI